MKTVKIVGLIIGLVGAVVVGYAAFSFARQAGAILLATLRSGERTALYNEQIVANLASSKLGERLASATDALQSVLAETTLTLKAVQPALQETAATVRSARTVITETAATAKAARVAIEGAKAPDVDSVLRRTDALLEQATTLLRDANAQTTPVLTTSERLLDHLDHLVADSELTSTLRTTGRMLANVERDQGNVSTLIANTVPVSEVAKQQAILIGQNPGKANRMARFFRFITRWL